MAVAAVRFGPNNLNANKPPATTARTTIIVVSLRPGRRVDSLGATSSTRTRPSGVNSNAQARISAIRKPSAAVVIKTFITQAGASNVGKTIEAAWISNQATTRYATATL
jgi:hypothetical protein